MDRRTFLRNVTACGSSIFLGSLAGCAGNNDSDSATTAASTPTTTESGSTPTTTTTTTATEGDGNTNTTASAAATVVVSSTEKFGDILTDSKGVTLYLFTKDKPGKSVCYDGCATNWPPLIVGGNSLKAGPKVTAQLNTIQRKNGSMQVTVADHPLYYYAGDAKPGDTNGQGLGGVWFVVGPDGQKKAKAQTATPPTTTITEDSGGYGGY